MSSIPNGEAELSRLLNNLSNNISKLPDYRIENYVIPNLKKLGWPDYQIAKVIGISNSQFSKKYRGGK